MKQKPFLVVSLLFALAAAGMAMWLYPHLPGRIPSHWNLRGEVDGWQSRLLGAAMPTLMVSVTAVVGLILPLISPRRFRIKPFAGVYFLLLLAVEAMMLVTGLATLLASAGYDIPVHAISLSAVGVLLIIMGNYMGKVRKNFFIGIRTPWTLADDDVWERTHRLGGRLFMLAGVLFLLAGVAGGMTWVAIVAVVLAAIVPIVYSLVTYLRLKRRHHS